ncbi:MAG: L,D-transpeptidase family protein [Myxococcota bacterium]
MWIVFLLLTSIGLAEPLSGPSPIEALSRSLSPTPSCPNSISVINLPSWVDPKDPRLQNKGLIVVHKEIRRISRFDRGQMVFRDGQPMCWNIGLGFTPKDHKQVEGDGKTPEGWYRTSDKPWSQFYAAIAVHYPNVKDANAGHSLGRISSKVRRQIERAIQADEKPHQTTALGGEILIHGGGSATDWTLGCIAMDNDDIDRLRSTIPENIQTDVLILP